MKTKKPSGASSWVDPDDAPALTREHFLRADVFEGETLIRRGKRGRPPIGDEPKKAIKLRLPVHVIEVFKSGGAGWHTRISDALEREARRIGGDAGTGRPMEPADPTPGLAKPRSVATKSPPRQAK